jgi:hypothetical protein
MLSTNIDPNRSRDLLAFHERRKFEKRLALARRCLYESLPRPLNWLAVRYEEAEPIVRLRDFAVWAHSVEWDVPLELTALRSSAARRSHGPQIAGSGGRRGPQPKLTEKIVSTMVADLRERRRTVEELEKDTLTALVAAYGGSPNTVGPAREKAIAEFQNSANSENSEKL